MGLFDSIVGEVAGNLEAREAASHPLVGALSSLVSQNGGAQGLMDKLSQGGLDSAVASWVGTEAKQAVSAGDIQKVLGDAQINELASKLGVDPATASSFLAQHLPMIMNQLAPNGQAQPDHQQAIASLLPSLLQGLQQTAAAGGTPPAAS